MPSPAAFDATALRPHLVRMTVRALARRCPQCGARPVFAGYFTLLERCPGCGLRFHRQEGQMTGDIGINTIVTMTLLFGVLLGGTLLMWGHLDVMRLGVVAGFVAVVFPILFQPLSKLVWLAIDLQMRAAGADELDPAWVAGQAQRRRRGRQTA
jgi:uncharacterized protein (DUF983 family)